MHRSEAALLLDFLFWWRSLEQQHGRLVFVGYFINKFDMPFMLERLNANGFGQHKMLTIDIAIAREKLDVACARYGIKHANGLRGHEMPAAFERGDFEAIRAHCLDDVRCEHALFQAMQGAGTIKIKGGSQ